MTHLDLDSDVQPPTTAQQTTDKILYFTRHAQAEHKSVPPPPFPTLTNPPSASPKTGQSPTRLSPLSASRNPAPST